MLPLTRGGSGRRSEVGKTLVLPITRGDDQCHTPTIARPPENRRPGAG
jgi:hypothetical protein